jgi:transcription termination factor Rho
VDIVASGTRQEALLSSEQEAGIVQSLRRKMSSELIGSMNGVLDQLRKTQNNIEFLTKQQKPGSGRNG